MRRWQAVVEALEGLDGGASSAVVDALQTKQGKATVFMADTLLYVDMRRRRLRWSIKLPHLTTVTTHGAYPYLNLLLPCGVGMRLWHQAPTRARKWR